MIAVDDEALTELESPGQGSATEQLVLPIPPMYLSITEFDDTIRQIGDLMTGPKSDDDGILRPEQYALDRVSSLLIDACSGFLILEGSVQPPTFPKAHVSPDLEGGIRIEWSVKQGTVCLVVPPKQGNPVSEYLCNRVNGKSTIIQTPKLSGWLIASWLKGLS